MKSTFIAIFAAMILFPVMSHANQIGTVDEMTQINLDTKKICMVTA